MLLCAVFFVLTTFVILQIVTFVLTDVKFLKLLHVVWIINSTFAM